MSPVNLDSKVCFTILFVRYLLYTISQLECIFFFYNIAQDILFIFRFFSSRLLVEV